MARVAVDVSLSHLDRPFDYWVTEAQSADAQPGVRVRVRFAGSLVGGFVLERHDQSDHEGKLASLTSVVSAEAVLTPEIRELAREVADHYAGSLADVLRLAIPPRHASVEREEPSRQPGNEPGGLSAQPPGTWASVPQGAAFLQELAAGASPRVAWSALPGIVGVQPAWAAALAEAVVAAGRSRRGALVIVPDRRDVSVVVAALATCGVAPEVLEAGLGPRERYRRWLRVLRGQSTVVVGTRAASYAPVSSLGLIAVWDDGDDLHAEPRAPYPHVREVAAMRARREQCALIVGGLARTAEVAAMVGNGFLTALTPDRAAVRRAAPRVRASEDAGTTSDPLAAAARLPTVAWRTAREGLRRGPVLIQVPRRGYLPRLACARCRRPAHCLTCHGPLTLAGGSELARCVWCGESASPWRCDDCGADRFRSRVVGVQRTAEELGRAFPGVPVVVSGGRDVRSEVAGQPALIVATPGAEPIAEGGYAAAVLLDAWALLDRPDLRASEEALRRWLAASALVRSASDEGRVVIVADAGHRSVQGLVRWDPVAFADAELVDRDRAGMPPARRIAVLDGAPSDVDDLIGRLHLPDGCEQLGPVPITAERAPDSPDSGTKDPRVRVVLRTPRRAGAALAAAIAAGQGERSVRKAPGWVVVRIDPVHW